MMKKALSTIVLALCITVSSFVPALAAKPAPSSGGGSSSSTLGNDVSYPQCGKRLPSGQAFGLVGVNGGLANNSNSCLSTELNWAFTSSGITSQPKAGLYVNTANPGNLGVADWPTSGTTPYGTCTGADDQACAYAYGNARAQSDVGFLTAASPVVAPASFTWWLDVETGNSWESNTANNQADLAGMTAYFEGIGASVGLYSTAAQWSQIAGTVPSTSNLAGLRNWRPGGATLATAQQACTAAPLTVGGTVQVTQFTSKNVDYDYSCH
ncbi:MAG TPA: hypothetical protein VFN56_04675 [Candidatus Saccharimonadales bacterium]|nr:hypothetical protein [Candidatus Saccharimonadales bacterium]